jgi:hypothetical protein
MNEYRIIRTCVTLSYKAYKISAPSNQSPFASIDDFPKVIKGRNAQSARALAWLVPKRRRLYIAFRGTKTMSDVRTDMKLISFKVVLENRKAKVHYGFYRYTLSLLSELKEIVTEYLDEYDSLILTGHSLGGAMAAIASPLLRMVVREKSMTCITFGSPKVGDSIFATMFQASVNSSYRVILESDPVPRLPPGRFQHPDKPVIIYPSSNSSRSIRADDHKIKTYMALLRDIQDDATKDAPRTKFCRLI